MSTSCRTLLSLVAFLWFAAPALLGAAGLVWETEKRDLQAPATGPREVEAHFPFKNAGPKPIRITSVKASCGCVASTASKEVYAPGESGEIVAMFAYGDRIGQQEKTITIRTDEPAQPLSMLVLRVFIPELVKIQPDLVFWRIGDKPDPKQMTVKIQAGADAAGFTATSSAPEIQARLEKAKEPNTYTLIVTPTQTSRPQTAFIRIETSGDDPRAFIAHVRIK